MEAVPGYLSLHQSAENLTLKWTPNQLMNGTLGDSELEKRWGFYTCSKEAGREWKLGPGQGAEKQGRLQGPRLTPYSSAKSQRERLAAWSDSQTLRNGATPGHGGVCTSQVLDS